MAWGYFFGCSFILKFTHVVITQIVVGVLEAIIYDTDADAAARVPHGVDGHDVQAQVGQVGPGAGVLLKLDAVYVSSPPSFLFQRNLCMLAEQC